jgi:2-iminoacetate synthase
MSLLLTKEILKLLTIIKKGSVNMYDVKSKKAEEFINDSEILSTLDYAEKNKNNRELIESIIEKAKNYKGISHREAAVLLECQLEDENEKMYKLAREIKQNFYGNRIVMFAPLYLSNYCVNGCVYCPYHLKNKHISRKKLSQEDIVREVIALQDMGHKRLALETGEDPINNPIEYILESIKTIYSIKHKNGAIRRVNVNIAATTVENYKKLKDAGIGTYILFQETYNKKSYEELHPTGPKHNYAYHTEAMDRAMEGGIDDVGIGVLFGLNLYRYDFVGILMHAEHLEAAMGVGPHTISVPRIRPADDIDPDDFSNAISDEMFEKIIAILRITVPYTGMIISTRESQKTRERALQLGISQVSGGSRTSVGGYDEPEPVDDNSAQFDVEDKRTLDQVVNWLLELGYIPSFCTACYREGRTGDRFMHLVKAGQISNCCQPNALLTLKEYLEDYASSDTKEAGEKLIKEELNRIPNEKVKDTAIKYLKEIASGKRDFRF